MKKLIILILGIPLLQFIIPPYIELNNIMIIESVEIECTLTSKQITLKEIIPVKEENNITYKHKEYTEINKSYQFMVKELEEKEKKKVYAKKAKITAYGCYNIKHILYE